MELIQIKEHSNRWKIEIKSQLTYQEPKISHMLLQVKYHLKDVQENYPYLTGKDAHTGTVWHTLFASATVKSSSFLITARVYFEKANENTRFLFIRTKDIRT